MLHLYLWWDSYCEGKVGIPTIRSHIRKSICPFFGSCNWGIESKCVGSLFCLMGAGGGVVIIKCEHLQKHLIIQMENMELKIISSLRNFWSGQVPQPRFQAMQTMLQVTKIPWANRLSPFRVIQQWGTLGVQHKKSTFLPLPWSNSLDFGVKVRHFTFRIGTRIIFSQV